PADIGILIQHQDAEAEPRGSCGGCESRRAGADDRQIDIRRERFDVADHGCASSAMARAPLCVSTRMPARTGIRQAWRLPMPSILTRHSKHTPIMQYGARLA